MDQNLRNPNITVCRCPGFFCNFWLKRKKIMNKMSYAYSLLEQLRFRFERWDRLTRLQWNWFLPKGQLNWFQSIRMLQNNLRCAPLLNSVSPQCGHRQICQNCGNPEVLWAHLSLALYVCFVFCCARQFRKLLHSFIGHKLCCRTCLAPEGLRNR